MPNHGMFLALNKEGLLTAGPYIASTSEDPDRGYALREAFRDRFEKSNTSDFGIGVYFVATINNRNWTLLVRPMLDNIRDLRMYVLRRLIQND